MVRSDDPRTAFAALFDRTSARVYGYVRRHCDDTDCDDIVSEVYLVAWRRLDDVPAEALPWLLATARRVLANHWRGRDRRTRLQAELRGVRHLAGQPDPAAVATDRAAVLAALESLTDADRELLLLVGWDGLDATDAGRVLGCSPAAARRRLSRARRRLQAALTAGSTGEAPRPAVPLPEGN